MIEVETRIAVRRHNRNFREKSSVEEKDPQTRFVNMDNVEQVKPAKNEGWGSVICFNSGNSIIVRSTPEEINEK